MMVYTKPECRDRPPARATEEDFWKRNDAPPTDMNLTPPFV
ncbi:predicted protein [Botrytis cinerea T4]|uniref:Uncharacterized protein n=1 Tax=Botryotinia fuckeliana (strain T4) TaxID=999810 RepID=G2YG72_BOTF4|nr:predicted protein [Botrytis cinerea T4]